MVENHESGNTSAEERGRFFRAADLTLREGGQVHSRLILERSGVSCTEQDMIDMMRAWSESRDYPLNRIHWGRMGSILMGLYGCGALILGLVAAIEGNRSGQTIGYVLLLSGIPLGIGAIALWRSTSRTRDEVIRRANADCPECGESLAEAASCGCGYLTRTVLTGDSEPSRYSVSEDSLHTPTGADTPSLSLPEEANQSIWQIRTGDGVRSYSAFASLREEILSGDVTADTDFRIIASDTDAEEVPWAPISEMTDSLYELGMLYKPIKAHMARGGIIGATIGIGWWLLSLLATAFGDMNNPVIGGIGLLTIWAVVNLRLSGQILFFSSRILWGAIILGAMFAFQNYLWDSIVSSVATGIGMVAGALFSGAVVGWLLGLAGGALTGIVRRDSLHLAPDAIREDARSRLLYGVVVPLTALVVLVGVLEILCQSFNLYGKRIESWQRSLILKQH